MKKGDLIRITNDVALSYIKRRHGIEKSDIGIIVWSFDMHICKVYFPRAKVIRPIVRAWIEVISRNGEEP